MSRTLTNILRLEPSESGIIDIAGTGALLLPTGSNSQDNSTYIKKVNKAILFTGSTPFIDSFPINGDVYYNWFAEGAAIFIYCESKPTIWASGTIQSYVHAPGSSAGLLTIRFDQWNSDGLSHFDWKIGSNIRYGAIRYNNNLEAITVAARETSPDRIAFRTVDNEPGGYVTMGLAFSGTFVKRWGDTISGDLIFTDSGSLHLNNGVAPSPGLRFTNHPTSGMYWNADDKIAFSYEGVEVFAIDAQGASIGETQQAALDLKAPLASPAFTGTPTGITKTHVGLGAVDNTSDANKPISTAQQAALDLKAPLASPAFTGTPSAPTASLGTNTTQIATMAALKAAVDNIVDAAPGTLNTLNELATALGNDANFSTTVLNALADRVAYTNQTKTPTEQGQARANIGAGVLSGFRNKVINGDFDVNQRGVVTGNTFARWFGPDRWNMNAGGTGTPSLQMSQQPNADTSIPGTPEFMGRFASNTTGTFSAVLLEHRIENVRTLAGKKATLTFYAKSSPAYGSGFTVSMSQNFGSGGSAAVQAMATQGIALTASFQKFQFVIDIPSVAGKTIGAGNYLHLVIYFPLSAVTLDLSHVSLVEGDATAEADPFSPRHIQQEQALCRRYFWRPDQRWIVGGIAAAAVQVAYATVTHPEPMRVIPSISWTGQSASNTAGVQIAVNVQGKDLTEIISTSGGPGSFYALGVPILDAEL